MQVLEKYLYQLNEDTSRNLNAPEFAYYTLYDEYPPPRMLRGRTHDHPSKMVNNVEIDKGIPTKAINELMKIKEIEMRSSCQGESENRPSFIIFRPNKQNKSYVEKLIKNLNKKDQIKAKYDIGKAGQYRVCVTWHTWYGAKNNQEWWNALPKKIKTSVP